MLSQETPNLNKIYEDELCTVLLHTPELEGRTRFVIHVEVEKTTKRDVLEHYYDVIQSTFEALEEKGVEEVEAWVCTDEEIQFAQFFGFDKFLGQLMVGDLETLPPVYMLKKDL